MRTEKDFMGFQFLSVLFSFFYYVLNMTILIGLVLLSSLPDPRGAGLEQAFQFSYVRLYVRPYVRPHIRTSVSEIKFWSLHIH